MAVKNSLAARFAKDKIKEEQGTWVDFGEGVRVRIRRFKSKAVQDARARVEKPYAEVIRRGSTLPADVAEENLVKVMAEAVISDWEGVTDENGDEILLTPETAAELLKAYPDFRDEVLAVSIDGDNYKAAMTEEAEGNS